MHDSNNLLFVAANGSNKSLTIIHHFLTLAASDSVSGEVGVPARVTSSSSLFLLAGLHASLKLCVVHHAAEEFEHFVDQNDGNREGKHCDPFLLVHRVDGEDLVHERDVDDDAVEEDGGGDGEDQVWVHERGHGQQ